MYEARHAFANAAITDNPLQHWYALLDHIPIAIFICDRAGTITRHNEHAAALWGAPVPSACARTCGASDICDTNGRPLPPEQTPFARVLRTAEPDRRRELILQREDGGRVFVLANADPLFHERGDVIGAVVCLQDVTAQKQAEARGAQARSMLEGIIETIPECIQLVAADGVLLRTNAAGCAMLGAPAAALVGRCVVDLVAPEHRALWRDNHRRVCLGERLSWAFDIVAADGARRRMETHGAPLTLPDGSLAHLAVARDVSERRREPEAAAPGRNELQAVLEALPAAVYTTDASGTITFFNEACVRMTGRQPRIGEDKWCVSWKLYRPDGTPLAHEDCPMAVALKENRPVYGDEIVAERPDGARVPIIPYPTPIRDASGALVGAINMLVDVSERKHAEFRQRMLLDELNHRVKNNLQMLYALLRAAERETGNREARLVLEEASHRVGAIAAAQRVLYGAESATRFETGDFLRAVCQVAQQSFAGAARIEVRASAGKLSNEFSMPLALILNELLTNAVKHGLKGRSGSVRVELVRAGNRFRLAVEDDGGGFELKPSTRRASGLGLVAGLARQIGGTFSVERGDGAGARCLVTFPESSLH